MTTITYCVNGCETRHGDDWYPVQTESPSLLCNRCEDRLHHHLTELPEKYALLPTFIEHGTTEPDPDGRTSKNPHPPAPMRLDVLDLLDDRLGRRWNATEPAHDRRGVIGTLRVYAERLAEERHLPTHTHHINVPDACRLLDFHRQWLTEQPWIDEVYDEVRTLHRAVSEAIGEYRRPSVGNCPTEDDEGVTCNGPIFGTGEDTARCARCGRRWEGDELAWLGRLQAEKEPDAATAHELALWYGIPTATIRKWAERGKVTKLGKNAQGQQTYDVAETRMMQKRAVVAQTA